MTHILNLKKCRLPNLNVVVCGGSGAASAVAAWERAQLSDPALRVFTFATGPAGGPRGVRGRRPPPPAAAPRAFYVNGQLAPDITLRRGLKYEFKVLGGNDPHSAQRYHPLVVTEDAAGGLQRDTEPDMRARRVLAGCVRPRRGRLAPAAAGPACDADRARDADPRRDAAFQTFRAFNRSLLWRCGPGLVAATLVVAPNTSWPDLVYYNSFTHAGTAPHRTARPAALCWLATSMGGRIFVVDRHRRSARRETGAAGATGPPRPLALLLVALAAVAAGVHPALPLLPAR
ncbi:hypothetical protein ACJJTC_014700 [Scirpophaga incertulas]